MIEEERKKFDALQDAWPMPYNNILTDGLMQLTENHIHPNLVTKTCKFCTNCGCTSTPSWRRCPNGKNLLCNACGLYQKLHNRSRPFQIDKNGSIKVRRMNMATENICSNCNVSHTPLWRRGPDGSYLCNACGLYYKQYNDTRPFELNK